AMIAQTNHAQVDSEDDTFRVVTNETYNKNNPDGTPMTSKERSADKAVGDAIDPKKEADKHAAAQSQFDAKWGASVVVGVNSGPVKSAQMLAFINWECDRGNPIMTGVTYTNRDGNKDEITDHWIVITGRVGPAGANQFSYNNPAEFGDAVSASSNVLAWT